MKISRLAFVPLALLLPANGQDTSIRTSSTQAIVWTGVRGMVWFDSFGTDATDWINRVIELRDGSLLAAGFVNRDEHGGGDQDVVLRKYRANGDVLWTKRIGGSGLDAAWVIHELPNGNFAIGGISSTRSAGENDAYLLIADAKGDKVSEHWFGGPKEDRATDLAVTPDGGILLVGQTESAGAGERDVFVVRTDSAGRELWRKTYGGAGVDRAFFVTPVKGGYAISGVIGTPENVDYMVLKIDEAGNQRWRWTTPGEGMDPNHGIAVRRDGNIVFTGYTKSWGSADYDVSAVILSPDGKLVSHEIIGAPGDDRVQYVTTAPDGSGWLTGYTRSFSATGFDIFIARLGGDGRFEPWIGAIGTDAEDNGSSITVARNGDLLVTGRTAAPSGGKSPPDAFVMRIRPDQIQRRSEGVSVRGGPVR